MSTILEDLDEISKRLDTLLAERNLFRELLTLALERLESSQPPAGCATDKICHEIRKALK